MTLAEQAATVQTRQDLVVFVAALAADLKAHPDAWANSDSASFLTAMAAWIDDMDGY